MTANEDEEITLETLAEAYMAATGCTRDQADELLGAVSTFWQCPRAELPRLVRALTSQTLTRSLVLIWLTVTPALQEIPGRALILHAALRTAGLDGGLDLARNGAAGGW